jgi:hypothetical protein
MARSKSRLKDVKAEKVAKKRKMKRRKRILFLLMELILLVLLVSASYMLVKYGKIPYDIFFNMN